MGCVVIIPKRDWLSCVQTRQEERSPVGTQRIVSIPEKDLASTTRVEFPQLTSLITFDRIALLLPRLFNELTKIKALITVTPNGVKNH